MTTNMTDLTTNIILILSLREL